MKLTTMRFPEAFLTKAKRKAKSQGRSFAAYVRWLIQQDIKAPKEAAIKSAEVR